MAAWRPAEAMAAHFDRYWPRGPGAFVGSLFAAPFVVLAWAAVILWGVGGTVAVAARMLARRAVAR